MVVRYASEGKAGTQHGLKVGEQKLTSRVKKVDKWNKFVSEVIG